MVKFILVSVVGLMMACSTSKEVESSENQVEEFDVVINTTTTQVYCGGAKPTEEILEELRTPKSAPNVKIYLRKGSINDIKKEIDYQLMSNDSGVVKTSLPAGTYSIVFENKKDQGAYDELLDKYGTETSYQTAIDTSCLKTFFAQPNGVLVVEENNESKITVNRVMKCQWTRIPCSNYKGDLPPSAPPK
jgi:hypothetical protein